MTRDRSIRPRLIRAALSLAPGTWNPAWRYGAVIRAELGSDARIAIDPRQVLGKIGMRTMNGLKRRFLVPGLGAYKFRPIAELATYRDVEDFAAHGDDYRATRLYRGLKQAADEGRPVVARGVVCDTEQRMLDYYFTYLELFRSLQQHGYAYRGEDEICFGVMADGRVVHMRRGTHRLASAHFLRLPFVSGLVTHADPVWVSQAVRRHGGGPLAAIALSLRQFQAPAQGQATEGQGAEGQTAAQ